MSGTCRCWLPQKINTPELQIPYPACPLCDQQSISLVKADCTNYSTWHTALPTFLEWMRCTQCQHIHTRYYWSEAGITEVFRNAHANQLAGSKNPDSVRTIWSPVIHRAISLIGGYDKAFEGKVPNWVDVGCGDGGLIMTAADFGFNAVGLDARAQAVNGIKHFGYKAVQADFMKVNFDGQVDVLSMMDVLEHLPYPRQALLKAAAIIRQGGIIVLSMPDSCCSSWRQMDAAKANPYWMEIEHHHNFSRQRLSSLLNECGFEVVDFAIPQRYKAQMEMYARLTSNDTNN